MMSSTSGNWTWTDGTSLNFVNWAKGEPQNITGNDCAALSITDGLWRSDDCFKAKPYICNVDKSFYEPSTTTTTTTTTTTPATTAPAYAKCPDPFIYFEPTESCYGVGNWTGPLTWEVAEKYCEAFGAHLASVHSSEEAYFMRYNYYVAGTNFWIGAFSNDGGLTWKWSDGTSWDYNPWAQGYPNTHKSACGQMLGGAISDQPCIYTYRPICKKPYK
uniref:C-type lectin domain-containing protein n=1 Tax=Panagrolaimus superbus TaxID=310955 RepID=A0A914YSS5_9BILA